MSHRSTPSFAAGGVSYLDHNGEVTIPRTRAQIVRYAKVPWNGVGNWSSSDNRRKPVYEDNNPYREKLPAYLFNKNMLDITPEECLWFARAADRADQDLDKMIWYKFIYDPILAEGGTAWVKAAGTRRPSYSFSLDHAILLYTAVPDMIPSDPLDVIVQALTERVALMKEAA